MAADGREQSTRDMRNLPSVDAVLRADAGQVLVARFGHREAVDAIRDRLKAIREGCEISATVESIAQNAMRFLEEKDTSRLKQVFNLTGTVLHTNLGRAQIAEVAIEAAQEAMRNAVALEFDVASGGRGDRDDILRELLCTLTWAEDATVVNNNAAAVLLALNTFSQGKQAIVSRGELIEIGGAFRMPEIMARAGADLKEVGTTNRTHLRDYEDAISEKTGLLLKVHTSNYRVEGFTAEVTARELASVAHTNGVPLIDDLGSGTLIDLTQFGLPTEPTVRQAVSAGADLVTFSGDKLLGGPQAGFIVGRKDLIARINANPMKRALRIDKMRLAAIEATLRLYNNPDRLIEDLPTYRFLARSVGDIRAMAEELAPIFAEVAGGEFSVSVVDCSSQVGSGAMPTDVLPSVGLSFEPVNGGGKALGTLSARFRAAAMPIIGRISKQALILDLRCLGSAQELAENLRQLPKAPPLK